MKLIGFDKDDLDVLEAQVLLSAEEVQLPGGAIKQVVKHQLLKMLADALMARATVVETVRKEFSGEPTEFRVSFTLIKPGRRGIPLTVTVSN